jgi:VanZ family protein
MKKLLNQLTRIPFVKWGAPICWTLGIFYGCSLPGKNLPKLHLFDHIDKVVHFIFFFVFALLWHNVFIQKNKSIWWSICIGILYGIAIEIYQKYCVLGRSFDVWDIVADAIGALAIVLVFKQNKLPNK